MIADKGLETIVIIIEDSGVMATARRTPVGGWSRVSSRGALERTEGLGVTPSKAEHMEEISSSSSAYMVESY